MADFDYDPITNLETASSVINSNFEKAKQAFEDVLPKNGSEQIEGNLNVNHFKLQNVANAVDDTDAPNLGQVRGMLVTGGATGTTDDIPEGDVNLYYTDGRATAAALAAFSAGTDIDITGGVISYVGAGGGVTDLNEIWLDDYYATELTTDTEALQAFAAEWNTGAMGDVTLRFSNLSPIGPSGRFLIDEEIEFTHQGRLVIDFGTATTRFTTAVSKFKFSPGQVLGSSSVTNPSFFVVKGGVHQYTAGVDCLFWWNFTYIPSRSLGTGYAEDMRIHPQSNNDLTHTLVAPFRTSNTWYFGVKRVHYNGPPRSAGAIVAGTKVVDQEGLCVQCSFDDVEINYVDVVIDPGYAAMVGVEGSFTSGTYTRGKALRQGASIAYFGRNDGGYGYTYSLYDETGTLTTGAAELLDSDLNVVGSFNITTIGRYNQASEGVQVKGSSTSINSNYFANKVAPSNPDGSTTNKMLNWGFHDMHMAYFEGFLKLDHIADLQVGQGVFAIASVAGKTCFDINNGDFIDIRGVNATTNGLGGTFFKGRNITAGHLSHNTTYFYATIWDLDNTVKSFKVHGNTAYEVGLTVTSVNTGNRYNGTSTRGIDFRGNGFIGRGFDVDDIRKQAWNPTVTSSAGSITSYTVEYGHYRLCNGLLTMTCKLTITDRGAASGTMTLTGPPGIPVEAFQCAVTASLGNNAAQAVYNQLNNTITMVNGDRNNTSNNAFAVADVPGNYVYYFNVSLPIEID